MLTFSRRAGDITIFCYYDNAVERMGGDFHHHHHHPDGRHSPWLLKLFRAVLSSKHRGDQQGEKEGSAGEEEEEARGPIIFDRRA